MATRNRGVGYLVASALVALAFTACGPTKTAEAPPPAETAAPEAPPVTVVGTIDFLEGEVSVRVGGADWRQAEIGDQVSVSDAVRTGAASSCDLGFGPFGLVRLDADSTVELKTISLSAERKVASVKLAAGSVACKVSKLTGNDRFEVRTQTAVCGVRGTEFLVKEEPGKPMKVAVREGAVAVLPPSFDADVLEAAAVGDAGDAMVEAVVREIVAAAPLVAANEESTVSAAEMAASDKSMAEINEVVVRELEVLAASPAPAEPAPAAEAAPAAEKAPAAAPAASQPAAAQPAPAPAAPPVKISAAVTATLVKFTAKAETIIAPPAPIKAESMKKLEKLPETLSAASAPKAEAAPAAEPVPVAAPAETAPAAAPAEKPAPAPLMVKFAVAPADFVGGVVASGSRFHVADVQGRLYAFAADGSGKKTYKGDGASNENSRPVPIGETVYYAGSAALVAFDAASGAQLFARPLDSANSGFFGRRPAVAGDKLFSSSDAGLDVYNPKTGEKIGSVALSEGSDMTPAVSGGSVYIVTRSGAFCEVSASSLQVVSTVDTKAVEPIASAPLIAGDRAYFADRKGTAFCVDLAAKAVAWKRPLEAGKTISVFDDPVAAGKSILFYGKNAIYGLAAADGTPSFAPVRNAAGAPCVTGSTVWYGGKDNAIVALDGTTGKVLAKLESGGPIVGRPAAAGNSVAFPLASGSVGVVDAGRTLAEGGER